MTVRKLIILLQAANLDTEVYAYDADSVKFEKVSGLLYDLNFVRIETDKL
jgi:hypothetical protein